MHRKVIERNRHLLGPGQTGGKSQQNRKDKSPHDGKWQSR
jgi:hypothetical protein